MKMMKKIKTFEDRERNYARHFLFSYIDNVLEHHFATFQNEITELYNINNKSIF